MSEQKHTPLPWAWERYGKHEFAGGFETERPTIFHIGDVRVVGDGEGRRGYDDHAPDEDDAAFVVLAVNHHEQLMNALASILWEDSYKPEQDRITDRVVASAIYASARGESQ